MTVFDGLRHRRSPTRDVATDIKNVRPAGGPSGVKLTAPAETAVGGCRSHTSLPVQAGRGHPCPPFPRCRTLYKPGWRTATTEGFRSIENGISAGGCNTAEVERTDEVKATQPGLAEGKIGKKGLQCWLARIRIASVSDTLKLMLASALRKLL